MWFIGEAVLMCMGFYAGCRVIKLGFKMIGNLFDGIDDKFSR